MGEVVQQLWTNGSREAERYVDKIRGGGQLDAGWTFAGFFSAEAILLQVSEMQAGRAAVCEVDLTPGERGIARGPQSEGHSWACARHWPQRHGDRALLLGLLSFPDPSDKMAWP